MKTMDEQLTQIAAENPTIRLALRDLLDTMGALSNPNEIAAGPLGLRDSDVERILRAREIILADAVTMAAD